jgi:hypothetical protein
MLEYRLYFIERGHIAAADAFEAVDDGMAIAYLESRRRGRLAELWCRDRIVRRYAQDAEGVSTNTSAAIPTSTHGATSMAHSSTSGDDAG